MSVLMVKPAYFASLRRGKDMCMHSHGRQIRRTNLVEREHCNVGQ